MSQHRAVQRTHSDQHLVRFPVLASGLGALDALVLLVTGWNIRQHRAAHDLPLGIDLSKLEEWVDHFALGHRYPGLKITRNARRRVFDLAALNGDGDIPVSLESVNEVDGHP